MHRCVWSLAQNDNEDDVYVKFSTRRRGGKKKKKQKETKRKDMMPDRDNRKKPMHRRIFLLSIFEPCSFGAEKPSFIQRGGE